MKQGSTSAVALVLRTLLLAAALLAACVPARAQGREAVLRPDLESLPLADLVRLARPFVDRPVTLEGAQAGSLPVTLYADRPLTGPELRAVLVAAGRAAGLKVEEGADGVRLSGDGPPPAQGLAVFRPGRDLTLARAAEYARRLASAAGRAAVAKEAGAVVLADGAERTRLVVEALRKAAILERDLDTEVVRLHGLSAMDAAARLDEFYWNLYAQGRVGHAPILVPLEWAGCLLAAAEPKILKDALDTLRRMDP